MEFTEKDANTLDRMLDILIYHQYILVRHVKNDPYFKNLEWEKRSLEFVRLMYFFELFGCAQCSIPTTGLSRSLIRVNTYTPTFKENGGFLNEFHKMVKKNKLDAKLREKEINDARLSKWKVKTFWPLFAIAIVGTILSIYNFILNQRASKDEEQLELRIEQMESELSRLRTLISDQKNQGPSSFPSSLSDTLNLSSTDTLN
ncbi:hypothetical protein FGF1_03930 [Flavobacteriaceae bacterium GF1]